MFGSLLMFFAFTAVPSILSGKILQLDETIHAVI